MAVNSQPARKRTAATTGATEEAAQRDAARVVELKAWLTREQARAAVLFDEYGAACEIADRIQAEIEAVSHRSEGRPMQ